MKMGVWRIRFIHTGFSFYQQFPVVKIELFNTFIFCQITMNFYVFHNFYLKKELNVQNRNVFKL